MIILACTQSADMYEKYPKITFAIDLIRRLFVTAENLCTQCIELLLIQHFDI